MTFFAQANIYLKNLEQTGNYNCYIAEKSRVKIFQMFVSDRDIVKGKPTGKKDVKETGLSDIAFRILPRGFCPGSRLNWLPSVKVALERLLIIL